MNTPVAKILAVKFDSYIKKYVSKYEVSNYPIVVDVFETDKIKEKIQNILFSDPFPNYALVGYDNRLFVCSPIDVNKKEFVRHDVSKHPFSEYVKIDEK